MSQEVVAFAKFGCHTCLPSWTAEVSVSSGVGAKRSLFSSHGHLSTHLLSGNFLLPFHDWTEGFLFALTPVTHISIMLDNRKPHKKTF